MGVTGAGAASPTERKMSKIKEPKGKNLNFGSEKKYKKKN